MNEEKVLLGELNGIITYPTDYIKTVDSSPIVLMLHGFGSDLNEVDNFYLNLSRQLSLKNIISFRIDFRGYGSSGLNPEKFTIEDMVNDSIMGFNYIKTIQTEKNKIAVVGFSLGAAIALLMTQYRDVENLVLISPALNLLKDFEKFLGENIISELAHCKTFLEVNLLWRKITIGKRFYESLHKQDVYGAARQFRGNLSVIAGQKDFSADNASKIAEISEAKYKKCIIEPNSDHVFNISYLPTVSRTVTDNLIQFFTEYLC